MISLTRVEAGSNTSTVTLRVVGGDEKGSLKSETVKSGHESQGTQTRERLRWQGPAAYTNNRPVFSPERAPHKNQDHNCLRVIKIWSWLTDHQSQCDFGWGWWLRSWESESESELLYDWQFTANQFVLAPSPLRLTARIFFQLNTCGNGPYVTSLLTRRWVCLLWICLAL
jgi:hypothetical protein